MRVAQKVTVYIRYSGTRKYEKANPKTLQTYQGRLLPGCDLRLAVHRSIELSKMKRGEAQPAAPKPSPAPAPKPAPTPAQPGGLILDEAIDEYLANIMWVQLFAEFEPERYPEYCSLTSG